MLEWERERAQERERERTRERERDREREDARQREIERMAQREKEIEKRVRDEEAERRIAYEKRLSDEISSLREDFAARQKMLVQQVEASISRLRYNLLPQAAFGGGATLPNAWERQLRDLLAAAAGKQSPAITMLSPEQPHRPHHPYGQPALHELHGGLVFHLVRLALAHPRRRRRRPQRVARVGAEREGRRRGPARPLRARRAAGRDAARLWRAANDRGDAERAGAGGRGRRRRASRRRRRRPRCGRVLESKSSAEEAAERQHLDSLLEALFESGRRPPRRGLRRWRRRAARRQRSRPRRWGAHGEATKGWWGSACWDE